MLAAFLAAVFFALSAIFAHRTSRMVGVVAANCARLWVATVLLAIWAHAFGHGLHGKGFPVYVLSGVVGFGVGDIGLFAALPRIGSRLTALMVQCLASPIAAALEWLWLGTRPTTLDLLCGAVILLGVGIAVAPDTRRASATSPPSPDEARTRRQGVLFGVMAAVGQAGGAVISRKAFFLTHAAGGQIDGGTAAYQRALGGLAIVTAAYFFTRQRSRPASRPTAATWRAAWPWIVANARVGATIGVSFYQRALSTPPGPIVLPIGALTPLIVVPFAFVFEHERPSARSLLGGALAVAAAVTLARLR